MQLCPGFESPTGLGHLASAWLTLVAGFALSVVSHGQVVFPSPGDSGVGADWHALDIDNDAQGESQNAASENGVVGTLANGYLGRYLLSFDLDNAINPDDVISVSLHLRLKAIVGTVPANASLLHSQTAYLGGTIAGGGQRADAYHDATFVDTGIDVATPSSGTGEFYTFDVTDEVVADLANDTGDALSVFRVQIDGVDASGELAPDNRYVFTTVDEATESWRPYLEIQFVPPPCVVEVTPTEPSISTADVGQVPVPSDFEYEVVNRGSEPFSYTLIESDALGEPHDYSWMSVRAGNGTLAPWEEETFAVDITATSLAQGVYTGHVTITPDCDPALAAVREIRLTITGCRLSVTPSIPLYRWIRSSAEPVADVVFTIENTGLDTLTYDVSEVADVPWLSFAMPTGTLAPGERIDVAGEIDPGDLAPGSYTAQIEVTDDCAVTSPKQREITLVVDPELRPEPNPASPHVVYILSDDLGYGSVGCYGAGPELVQTPGIDRLAEEGVRFTNANTPSAVCSPTRYGVVMGRYPWRTAEKHGVLGISDALLPSPARVSMASWLQGRGYHTAAIGKWHLGYQDTGNRQPEDWLLSLSPGPADIGFDYHFGIPQNHDDAAGVYIEQTGIWRLQSDAIEPFGPNSYGGMYFGFDAPQRINEEVMEFTTTRAIEWMRDQVDQGNKFFLYFTPVAVHRPITPSEQMSGASGCGSYGDFIQDVDLSVVRILDALDEMGAADNTIVVFTSDNGGLIPGNQPDAPENFAIAAGLEINGELRGSKTLVWEGGTRVPYVVRWPGRVKAGATSDTLVSLVDSFATIAELVAGPDSLPAGAAPDSFSFASALRDSVPVRGSARKSIITANSKGITAIRRGAWKYIDGEYAETVPPDQQNPNDPQAQPQLYHLGDDPAESVDLIDMCPEIAEQLQRELDVLEAADSSNPYPETTAEDVWALTDITVTASSEFLDDGGDIRPVKLFDWETYDPSDGISGLDTGSGAAILANGEGVAGTVDFVEWQIDAGGVTLDEIFFCAISDGNADPEVIPGRSLSNVCILADTDPATAGYETVLVDDDIAPVYYEEADNLLGGTALAKVYTLTQDVTAEAFRVEFTRASENGPRIMELSAAIRANCVEGSNSGAEFLRCMIGVGRPLDCGCYCGDRDGNMSIDMRDVALLQRLGDQ